jgi:predicted amidohydrolase YtcJ
MTDRAAITLVIVNARIRTGDPRRPWVDAAALAGGRVVATGSSAELRKRVPPGVRTIDAHGAELSLDELPRYG